MKYRIIFKVGYNEAWFEFSDLNEAGEFAKKLLTTLVPNEDTKKRNHIRLEIINSEIESEEED